MLDSFGAALRNYLKYPGWKTGSALRFWKTNDYYRADLRNLIEIGEQLDLIMVRAQYVSLINRAKTFDEMRWWIDVCAPLADMREKLREKTGAHRVRTFVVPVNGLTRFIRETGPARNSRRKFVR